MLQPESGALVFENAPTPPMGSVGAYGSICNMDRPRRRFKEAGNEPRPEIYRNIFQAYGTYVVPLGTGLTVDFGKWGSSLGMEGNYTKDQMNYSRSYLFNYLPFYHMGARLNYKINDRIGVNYWVVNGTDQTEPFNGFKDELFGSCIPTKNISWTVNYYLGQEHPDVEYFLFGPAAGPDPPTNQGVPFVPIANPADRQAAHFRQLCDLAGNTKLHFRPGGRLCDPAPVHSLARRSTRMAERSTRSINSRRSSLLAARTEYLSDRGSLFSGVDQALKETTLTASYRFGEGFLMRGEWRIDFSNQPYF